MNYTINDKSSGNIISRTGDLTTTVKFFFWANKNQMPVKFVCVDWGYSTPGGRAQSSTCGSADNFYKNHRGWRDRGAGASECDGTDFGQSPQACTTQYFSMDYTYTCTGSTSRGWTSPCPDRPDVVGGCCVFVPRVQVKDNWPPARRAWAIMV